MDIDRQTQIVADIWYEITSISPRKKYEIYGKKKNIIKYLPTLQMMGHYFDVLKDTKHLDIELNDLKYLVFAFHRVYVGILCQS